jgi:type IX secretion system PorP/SprF family membrane protein
MGHQPWTIDYKQEMRKLTLYLLLLFSCSVATGQDPYFSQYFSSPLSFNPALTGYIDGSQRLAVNFRNQWANISTPYQTAAVSFDTRIMRKQLPDRDRWGLGLHAMYDVAAGGIYKNSYIALSTGFNKGLDEEGNQSIGIGIQAAFGRNVVDFNKISFGNQFTSSGFDLSVPSGESINNRSVAYASVNAGILYNYADEAGNAFSFGAAAFNLTGPRLNFFTGQNSRLARRYVLHGSALLKTNEQDEVFFSANLMQQARNTQAVIGGAYGWGIGSSGYHLYTGAWLRAGDAVYPYTGLRTEKFQVGISYDITQSDLRKSNGFTGSSEISFIWFFDQRNKGKIIPCFF